MKAAAEAAEACMGKDKYKDVKPTKHNKGEKNLSGRIKLFGQLTFRPHFSVFVFL